MPQRIADDVIERLKQIVSLERIAEARGVVLKRHGADLIGHCPFHDDKTPSLVITPAKNLWHCLGACQCGGTVIDWVMKAEGVSFRHAVELLQNDYQPLAASASPVVKDSTVKKLPMPIAHDAEDNKLLMQVIDFYHQALLQSPDALAYLNKRGIGTEEAIKTFKLGYANRTLGYRLPEANRVNGAAIRGRLQRLGIYRESGHEHFNGSLIIPIINEHNEVTEVYGRKIAKVTPGTPLHLYLPGSHRGVWNEAALHAQKEIILCESLIDALTFWCAGFRNVTASYGIEGFTADHMQLFKQCGVQRILLAYDRDEAGDRAAEKLSKELLAAGLDCYRILFPKGMDANEYALKVGPANKSLGVVIHSAQWLGNGEASAAHRIEPSLAVEVITNTPAQPSSSLVAETAAKENSITDDTVRDVVVPITGAPSIKASDDEVVLRYGDRRYRVRGLQKNLSYETLKINLLAACDVGYYVDTFDLYSARQRYQYLVNAAKELALTEDLIKTDLGKLLSELETLQHRRIEQALKKEEPTAPTMSEAERAHALELLRDPKLLDRLLSDFEVCGLVGERTNKLVGYLAAVSRKLDRPLAVVVQSSSAAGKSSLMDAVLQFMPSEERIKYSAMTGQSLFYMGEMNLKHKILAIVEEEGASRASYALKLLQSEGELTIASTGKDPQTGNLVTQEYHVEGPVMIMLTTTAIEIDEELLNRCLVLSVDEGREQTEAIHRLQRQRRTLAGLKNQQQKTHLLAQHANAQRLLRPLKVLNPYADQLTFLSDKTRMRRDHEKYLTLIDVIALLHQYQRPIKTTAGGGGGGQLEYIEVTLDDVAMANTLAHEVLGRSLDELPPQTRRLLQQLVSMVETQCTAQQIKRSDYHFSRRAVREHTRWGDTQLRVHLERLVELEYLLVHRGMRGQSFVYELLYDGQCDAQHHLSGLIDVATLQRSRGSEPQIAGSTRGENGLHAVGSRSLNPTANPVIKGLSSNPSLKDKKPRVLRANGHDASYLHATMETVQP